MKSKTKAVKRKSARRLLPAARGSASEQREQKRDWIKMLVMVENTDMNRKLAIGMMQDLQRISERCEGEKIVKGEALQIFAMRRGEVATTPNDELKNAGH